MNRNISSLRKEYTLKHLDEGDVCTNPFDQFTIWFNDAINAKVNEPNAMVLATSTTEGKPSARVVLLKGVDNNGLSFFTNYESRKAFQIDQNPHAALVFFWPELERQIRVEGSITKVSEKESDDYFNTRPEGSKLGAWASPQSKVIANRDYLESLSNNLKKQFEGKDIFRPKNWGGFRLNPYLFEFWQGRPNRLHDRIQYTLSGKIWRIERLAP